MNTTIDLTNFGGIVAGLLVVGSILKNAFPKFPNRFIPLFTWISGIVAYQLVSNGWTDGQQWLAAIITAATATGIHSSLKNTVKTGSVPIKTVSVILAVFSLATIGCQSVAPGNDPVIVYAERVQTTARAGFDAVLDLDHSDRGFWKTNAPAFHQFCEWLRQPQDVPGLSEPLPRDYAMLWNLDQIKLAYKASQAPSNAVFSAIATVTAALNQANAWLTVTTNTP